MTRFLGDQVDQLDRFTKDQVVLEKEELQKCLKTISTIIIGKCSFLIMFGRTGEFNVLVLPLLSFRCLPSFICLFVVLIYPIYLLPVEAYINLTVIDISPLLTCLRLYSSAYFKLQPLFAWVLNCCHLFTCLL